MEQFSVLERLHLGSILRTVQGDITTLRLVRKFREALSFSEEEHKELGLRQEGAQMVWNQAVHLLKDIEVGPKVRETIATTLMSMSKRQELMSDMLPLCDRFLAEEDAA